MLREYFSLDMCQMTVVYDYLLSCYLIFFAIDVNTYFYYNDNIN